MRLRFVVRAARVSAYVAFVSLAFGAVTERRAEAHAREAALAFGEQLLDMTKDDGDAHDLIVNGHHLHVAAAKTASPFEAVLERFKVACESSAEGMASSFEHLDDALKTPASAAVPGHPGIGLIKDVRGSRGVVVCFAPGERVDHVALVGRMERFLVSHDLADIGHLRYVAARALAEGGSSVSAVWTDAAFRLDEMFPAKGDALGSDPTYAPRPGHARRLLSARDSRAPHGAFVYTVAAPVERALADYGQAAERTGWAPNAAVSARMADTRAFTLGGVDIVVRAIPSSGEGSTVSILEMPAPGATAKPSSTQGTL